MTTRTAQRWNGKTRAPFSEAKRKKVRAENVFLGGGIGVVAVAAVFGRPAWILGAIGGAILGRELDPDVTG